VSEIPVPFRTGEQALDAIALTKSLSTALPSDQANAFLDRLRTLDVRVIAIGTVPHRMIFDKERIALEAGKAVEFRFSNTDNMPHNFAIVQPGSLEEIGMLAEATARDPSAMRRHYIPKSDAILLASRLLQPGENQAMSFETPETPGIYPYVCTYPGHWRRMYGALYVVENLEDYLVDPIAYLALHSLPLKDELLQYNTRGREWKFEELISAVTPLPAGRSFDVGRQLFKVANCVACHRLNDEGTVFGPDLAKLDKKKVVTDHILRSLLEPSKDIDEKFQSYSFVLESGKVITGMIVEEKPNTVQIVIDPVASGRPTVIQKSEIEERVKSTKSIMPKGLLDRLSREEILDLIAYIHAGGEKKHKLFDMHHHHN
jgi:putative heme-binding domain-containing protein